MAYAPILYSTLEAGYVDPDPADLRETRLATGRQSGAEGTGENPATLAAATSPATGTLIPEPEPTPQSPDGATPTGSAAEKVDPSAWRDELSARLTRYRARRKVRPPRYPSLRLRFDPVDYSADSEAQLEASSASVLDPVANHAFAEARPDKYGQMDGLTATREEVSESQPRQVPAQTPRQRVAPPAPRSGARIIEFPRFGIERFEVDRFNFEPPPPPPDQLAEPVGERIRILEVPEVEAPPPALGGITIAPAPRQDAEKRPGIDIPLQGASLARRILASLVDGVIIAAASALSGFIFWKVAAIRPPLAQMLGFASGVPCLFWAVFQYLLIVYAGRTPGLRAFGLELARFDGRPTSRSLRRWRVLASYLSAASLGMGYAWVFLDEDALCWHDRITHTYLARGKPQPEGLPKA